MCVDVCKCVCVFVCVSVCVVRLFCLFNASFFHTQGSQGKVKESERLKDDGRLDVSIKCTLVL